MSKIAIITPGIMPVPATYGGAVEVLIQHLIDDNEKNKFYDIDLYTVAGPETNQDNYKNTTLVVFHENKFYKQFHRICNKLRKIFGKDTCNYYINLCLSRIKNEKYDLIIVENSPDIFKAVYDGTDNKDRMLFHLHNNIDRNRSLDKMRYVVSNAKSIIVVSEYLKFHLNENVPNDKSFVLYNCVDRSAFYDEGNIGRKKVRAAYGIKDDEVLFMYSGRINKDKGVRELILAFRESIQINDKTRLMVVGDTWFGKVRNDQYSAEVRKISYPIRDKITFTGYVLPKDMPDYYAASDVVVIPSMWEEPFGVVGLESMAAGKAIIATKSGGMTEYLDDKCAVMIDRSNFHEEMVNAISLMASDSSLRERYATVSQQKINSASKFHSENYMAELNSIIKNTIP